MNLSPEQPLAPAKEREIIALWQEFQQQYLDSEAAQTFLGALVDAR
jgi:hypothetical protein